MLPERCVILRALPLAMALLASTSAFSQAPVFDGFDVPEIRADLWDLKDIRRDQFGFVSPGRCGADGAVAVRIDEATGGSNCGAGELCQRAEIRENPKRWLRLGDEAWYGFSFRVRGEYPDDGLSTRWILAQFKEQTDESPFLALRFDDGVFHITVQDDAERYTVASARHTIDRIKTYRAGLARLAGLLPEFRYVTDNPSAGGAALRVVPGSAPVLPDPRRDWVDLTLRVRAGRDGKGLVQVWANGRDVVSVEGNIGHRARAGDRQYFKFGQYRAQTRHSTELLFDQFRRGTRREHVYPVCR